MSTTHVDAEPAAPEEEQTLTGQRTHRALRLSLAFVVLALFAAVLFEWGPDGNPLPSISHYYYTPAGPIFAAALIAAALAMLALSGRGVETALLDIAALFAPLIAIVPTGIDPSHPQVPGLRCPGEVECVPTPYEELLSLGVKTYLTVLGVGILVAILLRFKEPRPTRWNGWFITVILTALIVGTLLALLAFHPTWNTGFPFNDVLPLSVHFAVTIGFFVCFIAVPIVNVFRKVTPAETAPTLGQKITYLAVALLLAADVGMLIGAFVYRDDAPPDSTVVFWGEATALALFAVFWVVQTFQRWDERNQRYSAQSPRLAWADSRPSRRARPGA